MAGEKIIKLRRRGFTLIEVMIGVFVLVVSILAALSGFLGSMFLNNSSNNLTTAVNDAQYVLEQVKGLDYDTCIQNLPDENCYKLSTFTGSLDESLGETVTFDPAPTTIGSNLRKITVKISWQDKGQTRSFSLASYFAK